MATTVDTLLVRIEADMRDVRRDLAALELLHEKLGSLDGSGSTDSSYLDSHPGAEERIQLIRENQ